MYELIKSNQINSNQAFWLTPPREMPPEHRQPNAPCPKLAGNAYKALVDLPCDGLI
jgi:hypothetical protein